MRESQEVRLIGKEFGEHADISKRYWVISREPNGFEGMTDSELSLKRIFNTKEEMDKNISVSAYILWTKRSIGRFDYDLSMSDEEYTCAQINRIGRDIEGMFSEKDTKIDIEEVKRLCDLYCGIYQQNSMQYMRNKFK